MNGQSAKTQTVRVHVSGTIDLPLNLAMLDGLDDRVLAAEVLLECVKVSVAERLGCFDGVTVTPVSTSDKDKDNNRDGPAAAAAFQAEIDLQRLGGCIAAIQLAYNQTMARANAVREMLLVQPPADDDGNDTNNGSHCNDDDDDDDNEKKNIQEKKESDFPVGKCGDASCELRRAAMLALLSDMLQAPSSIVEAAAEVSEGIGATDSDDDGGGSDDDGDYRKEATEEGGGGDRDDSRHAAGYKPLLGSDKDDDEEEEDDDDDSNDAEKDYAKMGYASI